MRALLWCGAFLLVYGISAPVHAQSAAVFHGGYNPQKIQNVPIDTSGKLNAPVAPFAGARKPFSFKSLIPSFLLPKDSTSSASGGKATRPSPSASAPDSGSFQPVMPNSSN